MFSKKIIDGTQNGTHSGDVAIFWTWNIVKIDLLIKCVKELVYHLGTILGSIMSNFCVVKKRFFEIFHIYRYTLDTAEWYPKWYPNDTQNFFIEKYEISTF